MISRRRLALAASLACGLPAVAPSQASPPPPDSYIVPNAGPGRFPLAINGRAVPLHVSADDHPGVARAARDLQADIGRVTGAEPPLSTDPVPNARRIVVAGTLGKSPIIDRLVRERKLETRELAGRWETFVVQVVARPMAGVDQALVIAGSDRRGTIFGLYNVSEQIGVSPWHWWADVPVRKQASTTADTSTATWSRSVADNLKIFTSQHTLARPGAHVLNFWFVDPGVVLQKLVIDIGGERPSYLGPPESFRR